MRITAVFCVIVTSLVAGCFDPKIADGGFACDPTEAQPCPDGYFCRNLSGVYLCTTNLSAPTGNEDMASGGGGGGGGGVVVDMATPTGPKDMATLPPDLTPLPGNCTPADLVINEVQTGSGVSGGALDEFIEIYNPCGNPVTLTGAKLVYRADTATSDSSTLVSTISKTLTMQGYLLVANTGFTGSATPDYTYSSGIADGGGGVGLRDSGGTLLASMGWGTASNGFQQGSPAPTEAAGKSIARQPNGANTKHDSADFKSSTPTPGASN
jgi:hypothetical protein